VANYNAAISHFPGNLLTAAVCNYSIIRHGGSGQARFVSPAQRLASADAMSASAGWMVEMA
jgi:hypothetical protein